MLESPIVPRTLLSTLMNFWSQPKKKRKTWCFHVLTHGEPANEGCCLSSACCVLLSETFHTTPALLEQPPAFAPPCAPGIQKKTTARKAPKKAFPLGTPPPPCPSPPRVHPPPPRTWGGAGCQGVAVGRKVRGRDVLEWPHTIEGGGVTPPPPWTPSPPSDQSDCRGKKRNLQKGQSSWAIFGTQAFGSQTPPF